MYETVTDVEVERRIASCHETVREVAAYWRSKCADRAMPKRADIDPAKLKPYLRSITLVDVVPDERCFVYRLVGTQEGRRPGRRSDRPISARCLYAESLEAALGCYEYVARERRPFCIVEPYRTADDWEEHEDTVYLPLSEDGESVTMILVCTYCHEFKSRDDWFARRSLRHLGRRGLTACSPQWNVLSRPSTTTAPRSHQWQKSSSFTTTSPAVSNSCCRR